MKHIFLTVFLTMIYFCAHCQESKETSEDIIYSSKTVDSTATFIGGNDALYDWIAKNIKFPKENLEKYKKVNILTTFFVVEKDGTITNIKTYTVYNDLREIVEQAIKKMPKWLPALVNNKPVRCNVVIPITFEIKNR